MNATAMKSLLGVGLARLIQTEMAHHPVKTVSPISHTEDVIFINFPGNQLGKQDRLITIDPPSTKGNALIFFFFVL